MLKDTVVLMDEYGMFQYSNLYQLEGKDIEVINEGISSIAGTPGVVTIKLTAPPYVGINPARPIDPEKDYRVIIIEK